MSMPHLKLQNITLKEGDSHHLVPHFLIMVVLVNDVQNFPKFQPINGLLSTVLFFACSDLPWILVLIEHFRLRDHIK